MKEIKFIDIDDIKLGHAQDFEGGTGCSVVLCNNGASSGVAIRGGAPGTRETDLLNPMELIDKVHGIVLSGGSAFGLDASTGVMEYLENEGVGFDVGVTKVPIVCQAVLFDLICGDFKIRPNKKMGYEACLNSKDYNDDINGNIGAGTGATVGKIAGTEFSMKGGLGTHAIQIDDLQIGAIVAVNCLGDVINPYTNNIIAGALNKDKTNFLNTEKFMINNKNNNSNAFNGNTTIGIIVTNASFNKAQANKLSSMTHNAFGRTMNPAHTMLDGDTIFSMCTNKVSADINLVGMLSTRVMEQAIIKAVKFSDSAYGFISYKDFKMNE